MATRVGIDLSPASCRVVEIDAAPAWRRHKGETRVRSFAVLPPSGPETRAKLESLRKRHAAVVVWDGPSDHRQVTVTRGSYESMRADAFGALAAAGLQTRGVWADISPASGRWDRAKRRPVVVALASGSALASALQPLVDAGICLRSVTTPAMALASMARLRRPFSVPDAIEVYVALEEEVTCITLVRGAVLVAARLLAWGYVGHLDALSQQRERDDITTRLAGAIRESVASIGGSSGDIGQVCICGGLPELRSMTAPLMERLDVEVEPLDSLFGINAVLLPEPADEFRERVAELRLAWAAAADWPPPINLLRARSSHASKTTLSRAAVATGVAAGLVVGWRVEQSQWWRSTAPRSVTRTATNMPSRAREGVPTSAPTRTPAMAPSAAANRPPAATIPTGGNKPPIVSAPPAAITRTPVVTAPPAAMTRPPVAPAPSGAGNRPSLAPPPAVVNKAPVVLNNPPVVVPAPRRVSPAQAPAPAPERPLLIPPPVTPRAEVPAPVPSVPSVRPPAVTPVVPMPAPARDRVPAHARPTSPLEVALPFDAVLGTILYSPDRKLAIVDGRIVGPADEVRGARVVDITPSAVMLRDAQGRLRRLALSAGSR